MQPVHEWTGRVSAASEEVLLHSVSRGDEAATEELARRHATPMAAFMASGALTDELTPAQHVTLSAADDAPGRLPVRAAWLARLAAQSPGEPAGSADDAFLLACFRDLGEVSRVSLWHAVVEGDGPATLGTLLGTDDRSAWALTRTARAELLAAMLSRTPAGDEPACREHSRVLGAAPDDADLVASAAEHGRDCDACMLLVRRVILFATDRRSALTRAVAGDLAGAYLASRPLPETRAAGGPARVWARVPGPVRAVAGMSGAAATAAVLVGIVLGSGAVTPSGPAASGPGSETGPATWTSELDARAGTRLDRSEVADYRGRTGQVSVRAASAGVSRGSGADRSPAPTEGATPSPAGGDAAPVTDSGVPTSPQPASSGSRSAPGGGSGDGGAGSDDGRPAVEVGPARVAPFDEPPVQVGDRR